MPETHRITPILTVGRPHLDHFYGLQTMEYYQRIYELLDHSVPIEQMHFTPVCEQVRSKQPEKPRKEYISPAERKFILDNYVQAGPGQPNPSIAKIQRIIGRSAKSICAVVYRARLAEPTKLKYFETNGE